MTRTAAVLACALLALAPLARAEPDSIVRVDTAFQNVPVRPGDTLWSIAHSYLKDPAKWDQILKYNRLPTADPTIALPGMVLRVPVTLIKVSLRAARLTFVVNQVLFRRKETVDWKDGKPGGELFRGDTLRTLDDSKARVMFLDKNLLSLDPNSMAVIKPVEDPAADVVLRSGAVFAGKARVVTATARVTPRTGDTRYLARVEPDLSTRVEVFKGLAAVDAQGRTVEVPAGMQTRVAPGLAPEAPRRVEDLPDLESRAQEFASSAQNSGAAAPVPRPAPPGPQPEADAEFLRRDIQVIRVGQPIKGFHVQASRSEDFGSVVFDRVYDADERFTAADSGLAPGAYWWRIAPIDLLGVEGRFHPGHYYSVGIRREETQYQNQSLAEMISISSPEDNSEVGSESVRVTGLLRDERLVVEVNGQPVRADEDGNFAVVVKLKLGSNTIGVTIRDKSGNQSYISRHVTRL